MKHLRYDENISKITRNNNKKNSRNNKTDIDTCFKNTGIITRSISEL